MTVLLVLVTLLWLPGAALRRAFGLAPGAWGMGRFAVESSLSLGLLSLVLLPLVVSGAPLRLAPPVAFGAIAVAALLAVFSRRTTAAVRGEGLADGAGRAEILAFAFALAALLPTTLVYSGANVDDWWDLSFVRGWMAEGRFGFAQMALATEPGAAPVAHPRFLWSVWLAVQAVVATVTGVEPWRTQAGPLAALAMTLVVSAQAALARAVFERTPKPSALVAATLVFVAAWLWGSEALPLFVRGYQDKLFAGFVLAPVLVAVLVRATGSCERGARREHAAEAWTVAAMAIAAVSVHSLVFTMALACCGAAIVAMRGAGSARWALQHRALVLGLTLPALYPLAQAVALAMTFGDQGVALGAPDNPVVRAHLTLGRLLGESGWWWIVHPAAVFGPVAAFALAGVALAWRRRRDERAPRVLLALTLLPALLLFVPGIAAFAGVLWVPWMLYRLGWMVPVAPLLAYALFALAGGRLVSEGVVAGDVRSLRWMFPSAFALVVALVALDARSDRLRRDMEEHPRPAPSSPHGAAAVVYRFLAAGEGRGAVLAPPNFSELVPALTGKPVVAFPERGTLVFAMDEEAAYERLRARAAFFSAWSDAPARDLVAARYGVRWAVLPRRLVASGSEEAWMRRYGVEALLASRHVDERCAGSAQQSHATAAEASAAPCAGWWSPTREAALSGLGPRWRIALETRDYFVVEREPGVDSSPVDASAGLVASPSGGEPSSDQLAEEQSRDWRRPFLLEPEDRRANRASEPGDVLARVVGAPGVTADYDLPPRYVWPTVTPIWIDGPSAWEDAPAEVAITLDVGVACRIDAIVLVPHLPRSRREVLEVEVGGVAARSEARHDVAWIIETPGRAPERRLTVRVRSLLGNPVSLADVKLLGDRASCEGAWPVHVQPRTPQLAPSSGEVLEMAGIQTGSGRPLVTLARRAALEGRDEAARKLLAAATRREPSLVEAWIELGFAEDAAGNLEAAAVAFEGALAADSRSGWAHGTAAWAERRRGHSLAAVLHALRAASLDPFYADAWTILGVALGDLHLDPLAWGAFDVAERKDRDRNWPVLARAELLVKRGDVEAARETLRRRLEQDSFDDEIRSHLAELP